MIRVTGAKVRTVPKSKEIPKYPVIAGIALLALGVTIAWWAGKDVSSLFENAEIRRGQLWRVATNIFPHLDVLHLVFNLYWLWVFGTAVERAYGHLRTALLFCCLRLVPAPWILRSLGEEWGYPESGTAYSDCSTFSRDTMNDSKSQWTIGPSICSLDGSSFVCWRPSLICGM